jgi:hypothetical protein
MRSPQKTSKLLGGPQTRKINLEIDLFISDMAFKMHIFE